MLNKQQFTEAKYLAKAQATKDVTIVQVMRGVYQNEGLRGFWKGNGVNVARGVPESAIKYTCFAEYKRIILGPDRTEIKPHERFIAGSAAGFTAQCVVYPLEVIKTRLIVSDKKQYKSVHNFVKEIYVNEGITSFYRGARTHFLTIIPMAGIDLSLFETLKNYLKDEETGALSVPFLLICGMTSSATAQTVCYPMTMVKIKQQAAIPGTESIVVPRVISTLVNIYKSHGLRGIYRGWAPYLMKVVPSVTTSYVVFETVTRLLGINKSN